MKKEDQYLDDYEKVWVELLKDDICEKKKELSQLQEELKQFRNSKFKNTSISRLYDDELLTLLREYRQIHLEIQNSKNDIEELTKLFSDINDKDPAKVELKNQNIEKYFSIINRPNSEADDKLKIIVKLYLEFFRNITPTIFFGTAAIILYNQKGWYLLFGIFVGIFSLIIYVINFINLLMQLAEAEVNHARVDFVIFLAALIISGMAIYWTLYNVVINIMW